MLPCGVKADDWQYKEIYSDPLGWLYQQTVDFISPQIYWPTTHSTAPYEPLVRWWSNAAGLYGCHFYSSMTLAPLEKNNTPSQRSEILRQVEANRALSMTGEFGSVFYSAKFLGKLSQDIAREHYSSKALSPRICRKGGEKPLSPSGLSSKGGVLSWREQKCDSGKLRRYAVYAFPAHLSREEIMDTGGDGIDSRYLVRISYGCSVAVPMGMGYAVTAIDGDSVESDPVFL